MKLRNVFPLASLVSAALAVLVAAAQGQEPPRNLAAGRSVSFAALPDRGMPAATTGFDRILTDGKLIHDPRDFTKVNTMKVGWTESNGENQRINWLLDLTHRSELTEIAVHFARTSVPVWGEAFVSDDGVNWTKVADRSRWKDGSFYRGPSAFYHSGTKDDPAGYWWRWDLSAVHGRYVGVRFCPGMSLYADEWEVWGRPTEATEPAAGPKGDFSITVPQVFFSAPELVLPVNVNAPQSLACTTPRQELARGHFELELDLPAGVELVAPLVSSEEKKIFNHMVGDSQAAAKMSALASGARRYLLAFDDLRPSRATTRLYIRAAGLSDGQTGTIAWRYRAGTWHSPEMAVPFRAVIVPATPAPKRLSTVAFGLWTIEDTLSWPNALDDFRTMGFNTLSLAGESRAPAWMPPKDAASPAWKLVAEARQRGFKIFVSDSTFMAPWRKYPNTSPEGRELYCQFDDGTVSTHICPSYRGRYYQEELKRLADQTVEMVPDILFLDMEAWNSYGSTKDCEHCSRCREAFARSGLKSWTEWVQQQGVEMTKEALDQARAGLRHAGSSARFTTAAYALNPIRHTDKDYNPLVFQKLYPQLLDMANESVYSPYFPGHFQADDTEIGGGRYPMSLNATASRYRKVRELLPSSDSLAMLVPGDTGRPTGEALQWAILEAFCNGSNGMSFWGRVWNAESVLAYSAAVRAIGPVEAIILDGELIGGSATIVGTGRVSGMHHGNDFVLLVSDYPGDATGSLNVDLKLAVPSRIRDQITGKIFATDLPAGNQRLEVPLEGGWARLLVIEPRK